MTTALVRPSLPEPSTVAVAQITDVVAQVTAIREWCRAERDVEMAEEVRRRLAALERYVKDKAARSQLAAEQRRTELLIGELLGPAEMGRPKEVTSAGNNLHHSRRSEFRQLAEHALEVEGLIAEGVVSRPKLLALIGKQSAADITAPTGTYSVIVADPPWRYGNTSTRGAAEDHYPTMSTEDLAKLSVEVDEWAAKDCHLYLWATNNFLREAFDVIDAWGFAYKTLLTWVKPQIGMGNYFRSRTEHVLFCTRGSAPTVRRDISNVIEADRTQHSRKPDAFYDLVEAQSSGPYLEMFARRRRLGWDNWGNEA